MAKTRQNPGDFFKITGVVGPRAQVEFAATAAKVRYRVGKTTGAGITGKGLRIMASR